MSAMPCVLQSRVDSQEASRLPTAWRTLCRLLDGFARVSDPSAFLDECLDAVVEVTGADRGLVLAPSGDGTLRIVNGRAERRMLTPGEEEEVERTVIRRALDARSPLWGVGDNSETSGLADVGIVRALAVPLPCGAGPAGGILYVDFRRPRERLADRQREFIDAVAVLVAAVLDEQRKRKGALVHLGDARARGQAEPAEASLEDLLAFSGMAPLRMDIASCLRGTAPVLIVGESGTGKTLLARALATASGRLPVVRAVLGSSDDLNTIASELFGHQRGAFSGAVTKRVGLVEFADGGTLILDEVLNLAPYAQQLLLDFTQFGSFRPLGHARAEPQRANVRIVAATNGDLRAAVAERRFREDLYYRIAGTTLSVPPLRARRQDIPGLAECTLRRLDPQREWTLDLEVRRALVSDDLHWPGNVRELESIIRRARERAICEDEDATVLFRRHVAIGDRATAASIAPSSRGDARAAPDDTWQKLQQDAQRLAEREAALIRAALENNGGVLAHAARDLGVARTTLASKLDALGMSRSGTGRKGPTCHETPSSAPRAEIRKTFPSS